MAISDGTSGLKKDGDLLFYIGKTDAWDENEYHCCRLSGTLEE
jgi:hypothetical protein